MALANTPNMHRALRNNDRKKDENPEGKWTKDMTRPFKGTEIYH